MARDLVATSEDLLHPAKCSEIVIDVGPPGSIDSSYAHKPSLVSYKGDLYHFYCAVSRVNGREVRGISVARSRPDVNQSSVVSQLVTTTTPDAA